MVQSPVATANCGLHQVARAPLSILRTETVLSRFPIHHLAKRGRVNIHIIRTNAHGDLDVRWDVSYNERYGPPRQLAYRLDTLVINQLLDALPRPLPQVLKVGSLRQICPLLALNSSGGALAQLKRAFHQNASAYIVAYLRYTGRDGTARTLNTGFTRYSVLFTGDTLPDGTTADAVYLVLSEPYREILHHAPVRPLDYRYMRALSATPMALRLYELLSFNIFAALKHHQRDATLRYSDFCLLATQQRHTTYDDIKKQMHKVHLPHRQAGYLAQVVFEALTDAAGAPDWVMHYTPGPKARAEYAAFMRQPGAALAEALLTPAEANEDDLASAVIRELTAPAPPRASRRLPVTAPVSPAMPSPPPTRTPPPTPQDAPLAAQAHALVAAFYQRFHGVTGATPQPKELAQATQVLAQHGEAPAQYLVEFSARVAPETQYQPQTFGGILHYLPRALAAYEAQTTRAPALQTAADARHWEERYLQWRQDALAQLREALLPNELAALDTAHRARLVAEGTPVWALDLAVRVAVDAVLEARAELPPCDVWRQQQEASR
jgi:hypothetical protein